MLLHLAFFSLDFCRLVLPDCHLGATFLCAPSKYASCVFFFFVCGLACVIAKWDSMITQRDACLSPEAAERSGHESETTFETSVADSYKLTNAARCLFGIACKKDFCPAAFSSLPPILLIVSCRRCCSSSFFFWYLLSVNSPHISIRSNANTARTLSSLIMNIAHCWFYNVNYNKLFAALVKVSFREVCKAISVPTNNEIAIRKSTALSSIYKHFQAVVAVEATSEYSPTIFYFIYVRMSFRFGAGE